MSLTYATPLTARALTEAPRQEWLRNPSLTPKEVATSDRVIRSLALELGDQAPARI